MTQRKRAERAIPMDRRAFLRVAGRIRATAVQRCVVTLQPVHSEIDEPFEDGLAS